MLKLGIIGQPRSGKTTVYNAVAAAHADPDAYQARDEVRRTMVKVPDPRLDRLFDMMSPPRKVQAEIEYFDFPSLTGDAGEVALLPPALRELNALILVLRDFGENPDPVADARLVRDELILADLMIAEKRLNRLQKEIDSGRDENRMEYEVLVRCRAVLDEGLPLRGLTLTDHEEHLIRGYAFLSQMPLLMLINAGDEGSPVTEEEWSERLGAGERTMVRILRGQLEAELGLLEPADRAEFMTDYALETSALDGTIGTCYSLLGLITFFTGAPETEVRAWTVRRGACAPEAAGVIHSDFEQGFIRAEVVALEDLITAGTVAAARKVGKARLEGKEYVVSDGDYILFRFNV